LERQKKSRRGWFTHRFDVGHRPEEGERFGATVRGDGVIGLGLNTPADGEKSLRATHMNPLAGNKGNKLDFWWD